MSFLQFNVRRLMGVPFEDMGLHFKGGGNKQTSTQTSKPYQQGNYDKLLGGADSWLSGGGFDKNYGGSADFDPVAGFTEDQKTALGNMSGTGQGLQGIYNTQGMAGLQDMLGTYDPSKTGVGGAIDNMNERMNFDFATQQMPQIRQGAQGAGQFGSSRHGIAEGLAQDRLSQNMANANSQMLMQDQQNWNNNRMAAMQNLDAISKGLNSGNTMQYNAGAMQQGQNQNEIKGQLEKWAYENNVDVNDLAAYKNLISGDMGGTVTGVNKQQGGGGSPWQAIGTVGGAVLGGMYGGPAGASMGASAGGQIGGMMG